MFKMYEIRKRHTAGTYFIIIFFNSPSSGHFDSTKIDIRPKILCYNCETRTKTKTGMTNLEEDSVKTLIIL